MPERPSKLLPALYGGIIMGVISGVPFINLLNCLCCAGILFGGLMSVFFYKSNLSPGMPQLTSSDAVQLGALAGVFGAIVENVIAAVIFLAAGNVAGQAMYNLLDSVGFLNQMPPEFSENFQRGLEEGGLSPLKIFFSAVFAVVFGLLGGLIGYALFRQKTVMPDYQPPTPPPAQG